MNTEPTAAHINAITLAMGGFAMCLALRMPKDQREALANDLARLAVAAEKRGDLLLESMFIDLQNAVRGA
jgi:hypothetical protein